MSKDNADLSGDFHLGFSVGYISALITAAMVLYVLGAWGVQL